MADYDLGTARGRIEIDSSGATDGINQADQGMQSLDKRMQTAGQTMTHTGIAMAGAGAAMAAGFVVAVKAAGDFESQMNGIAAVSGASGKELDQLRDKALQLGKDTVFSAGDAAKAIEELVKAGIPVEGVLNGAADAAVNLAAAGGIEIPAAAEIAANAMNAFGLSAQELPHVVDLIAGAANASAIDVGEFSAAMQQAGAVANLNGISFDDLAVSIAAMGNAGIKGSDAGTSLKTFLQNLQPVTQKDAELMAELGLITEEGGNQFIDASGKIKPMREVFEVLQTKLEGMTDAQKAHTLSMLFGTDAVRASAIASQLGAEGFDALASAMGKVSADDVAEQRMKGLNGALEQLRGSFETLLIQVGAPFLGAVAKIVTVFTDFLNILLDLPGPIGSIVVGGSALLGVLLLIAGGAAIFVGTFAKIIFAFVEFKKALAIVKEIQLVAQAMQVLNLAFLTNPIFLVIAALVALGVIIFIFRDDIMAALGAAWDFIQDIFGKIAPYITGAFDAVLNWLKNNWDIVLTLVTGPLGAIILVVRRWGDDILNFISGAVTAVLDWIKANWDIILTLVTGPLGAIVLFIRRWGDDVLNLIVNTATTVFNAVTSWLNDMWDAFTKWIGDVVGAITGFVADLVARFFDMHNQAIFIIINMVSTMLSTIVGWIADVIGAIANFVGDIIGRLFDLARQGAFVVAGWVGEMFRIITGFLFDGVVAVAGWIADIIQRFFFFGVDVINTVWDFFSQLPGTILNAIGDLGSLLYDVGRNAIQGLWDGMKNMAGSVLSWAKDFAGDVVEKITKPWELFSPSRVFRDIGVNVMKGLLMGLQNQGDVVLDSVSMFANAFSDTFKDALPLASANSPQNAASVAQAAGVLSAPLGRPQSGVAGTGGQGLSVTINNPKPEAAPESLYRAGQKLAYLGVFEEAS